MRQRGTFAFWLCIALYLSLVWATSAFGINKVLDWVFGQSGAAWVQALGSIFAILTTVAIMKRQHELQVELANNVERGRQILMCTRALLACYGYLSALRIYSSGLSRLPEGIGRPFVFASLGTNIALLPMDLDSLAFLVNVSASDVLIKFSQLNASERQWHIYKEGLVEFSSKEIDPPLSAAQIRLGRPLRAEELATQVGVLAHSNLLRRTYDLEVFTVSALGDVPSAIHNVAARIAGLYPEAQLPTPPTV